MPAPATHVEPQSYVQGEPAKAYTSESRRSTRCTRFQQPSAVLRTSQLSCTAAQGRTEETEKAEALRLFSTNWGSLSDLGSLFARRS